MVQNEAGPGHYFLYVVHLKKSLVDRKLKIHSKADFRAQMQGRYPS